MPSDEREQRLCPGCGHLSSVHGVRGCYEVNCPCNVTHGEWEIGASPPVPSAAPPKLSDIEFNQPPNELGEPWPVNEDEIELPTKGGFEPTLNCPFCGKELRFIRVTRKGH